MVHNPITTTFIHKYFEDRGLCCHRIRCFQIGLESSLLRSTHQREMDLLRIGLPYQLPAAERSMLALQSFVKEMSKYRGSGKNGQQNSHSLYQQDGRTHDVSAMPLYRHYKSGSSVRLTTSPSMQSTYLAWTILRWTGTFAISRTVAIGNCYHQYSGPSTAY